MKLGEDSFWWPYISILKDIEVDIPAIWTADELAYLRGLQPGDWRNHLSWFRDSCNGDIAEPDQLQAMLLVLTRSRGDNDRICLSPLFDSVVHDYITEMNTYFHVVNTTNDSSVWIQTSNGDIDKYQILTNSYGVQDSGILFRDYGLIITTNQASEWKFIDSNGDVLHFGLYPNENTNEVQLMIPPDTNLDHFYTLIHEHLHYVLANPPPSIPLYEEELQEIEEVNELSSQQLITNKLLTTKTKNQMNMLSKIKKKRILNANLYRFHYIKSLRIASDEIEKLYELNQQNRNEEL